MENKDLTPAQKAALTRKKNKELKEAKMAKKDVIEDIIEDAVEDVIESTNDEMEALKAEIEALKAEKAGTEKEVKGTPVGSYEGKMTVIEKNEYAVGKDGNAIKIK